MQHKIFINCFPRLIHWLEQEVRDLGYTVLNTERMGLYVEGDYHDTYRLNYFLRTASKVLYELDQFEADTPEALHRELLKIPWEDLIPDDGYVSVGGFVKNDHIRDNRFAFMKVKDAIVDRIQQKTGKRPDSGPDNNRTVIYLHWHKNLAAISFDTSGETLTKHGYRKMPGKAPMMEPLAAAVLMASKWDLKSPLVNPMCGSGTIAIEAALMAQNRFPGEFRSNYGFMHTRLFDSLAWTKIREEAKAMQHKGPFPEIIASDNDLRAVKGARVNAEMAGVESMITIHVSDFRQTKIPESESGIIILNPEYGERLGEEEALRDTYKAIGDFFKQKCGGYTGYIFTGNLELAKSVGLRTSRKIEFFNARIDSRLLEYELYSGTRRT